MLHDPHCSSKWGTMQQLALHWRRAHPKTWKGTLEKSVPKGFDIGTPDPKAVKKWKLAFMGGLRKRSERDLELAVQAKHVVHDLLAGSASSKSEVTPDQREQRRIAARQWREAKAKREGKVYIPRADRPLATTRKAVQQRKQRSGMTPEQRENRRIYQRDWYAGHKKSQKGRIELPELLLNDAEAPTAEVKKIEALEAKIMELEQDPQVTIRALDAKIVELETTIKELQHSVKIRTAIEEALRYAESQG